MIVTRFKIEVHLKKDGANAVDITTDSSDNCLNVANSNQLDLDGDDEGEPGIEAERPDEQTDNDDTGGIGSESQEL